MKKYVTTAVTLFLMVTHSQATLILTNGDFDNDADLGVLTPQ